MKTSSAIILSSIILSVAIIFSALKISNKMYLPSQVPSALTVTTYDGDKNLNNTKDFISLNEAASYLRMDETKVKELIQNGKLNGIYTSYPITGGNQYIFSTSKLSEWMRKEIETREYLR